MPININDYNKLLNFLYDNNDKIFNQIKLLPAINGEFNFLRNLSLEENINEEIKNAAKEYINLQYDNKILNKTIKINNLNITKYCMDDLLNEINQYLNNKNIIEINKFEICKILMNYLPNLESNDTNINILNSHNDIRFIYASVFETPLKEELIQTKVNSIWTSVDKYIIIYTQLELQSRKGIKINANINKYIDLLNKYQSYFNFKEYNIIPNWYGKFLNIKDIEDYNIIPEEILDGIKNTFFKDLKSKSVYKGLNINGINRKTNKDLGDIIEQCFESKKEEESYNFDYRCTYEMCKIIIKYIPINIRQKNYQLKLYNLYKLFDKNIGEIIEIDSNENLYFYVNKGITQFINENLSDLGSVEKAKSIKDDIFNLINDNCDILDPINYSIIPNQLGKFRRLDQLYKDNDTFEELINIVSEFVEIKKVLMDKRITKFNPSKAIGNEKLKKKIDELIENNHKFDIKKTLELIPKNESVDKQKQKDLIYIYEQLISKYTKLNIKEIDLEPSFWDKTNEYVLQKFKQYFKGKTVLKSINDDEEKSLRLLETLYRYIPPELNENQSIKFMPNQYGELLPYKDLSEEKDLSQNFKAMLKKYFYLDISSNLKHKKLNYKIDKKLTINEEIIKVIKKGFNQFSTDLLNKSEEFIKFYPKIDDENDDNYVLKFIDCYKSLTGIKFEEEAIETNYINIWDRAIKILLNEILEKINKDIDLKHTTKRISLNEDETIEKLNIFYSILFKMNSGDKKLEELSYIPNEKGLYKKLKNIFINFDIDNEIKEVLSLINEQKSFEHILVHRKVKLDIKHNQKSLEDIALVIDKEIKTYYLRIDQNINEIEIDENLKKSCKLLINNWFSDHKNKIGLFDFVSRHITDISVKILLNKETKQLLEDLLITDPEGFVNMINFQNPNAPFFYDDDSISYISDESSIDATRDTSLDSINLNQNNINNYVVINYINNNNHRSLRRISYNEYVNLLKKKYEKGIKKYCLAQAIVYEKLSESQAFSQINWINEIKMNEEGELIELGNGHKYKVKKEMSDYEFIVKTYNNKEFKIKVKRAENAKNSALKFNFELPEWNLFKGQFSSIIFAFVSLKNGNPEVAFNKGVKFDEI